MSPEKKAEKPFNFAESFDSLSLQILDELKRSGTRTITVASFEHGDLNFNKNENWTTFHKKIDQELPVSPGTAGFVFMNYVMVKDPEYFLDNIVLMSRSDIELVASVRIAEEKEKLQKEFIGKMEKALEKVKAFETTSRKSVATR